MRAPTLACLAALLAAQSTDAATIRVPGDQPTIQAGVNAASEGDTVLVAPGTYTGLGNKNIDVHARELVLRSEGGPGVTEIDCEGNGRAFYFQANEPSVPRLEGFTIRNGVVSGPLPDGYGGGILCVFYSSPRISNCVIAFNSAANGGGIACIDSHPRLMGCAITDNTSSGDGGGLHSSFASIAPRLEDCTIARNRAAIRGGGIACDAVTTIRCTFSMNTAGAEPGAGGGGIYCGSASIADCSFSANFAYSWGGGVFSLGGSSLQISRCIFSTNSAGYGGAVYSQSTASVSITDCTLSGNSALSGFGGGLYWSSNSGSTTIKGTLFDGNSADRWGGGLYCSSSSQAQLAVLGCSFSENDASDGGGAYVNGPPSATFIECVFAANRAASVGGAIWVSGNPLVDHCTMFGNQALGAGGGVAGEPTLRNTIIAFGPEGEAVAGCPTLSCCDLYGNQGGDWIGCLVNQLGVSGNFSADPVFCDASAADLTLDARSPCAPNNSPPGCGLIGALPVGCGVTSVQETVTGAAARGTTVLLATPSPVRGETTVRFDLPRAGEVRLEIYDIEGRLVRRLLDGPVAAGPNSARWDGRNDRGHEVVSGVYLVHLSGEGGSTTSRLTALR